MSAPPSRPTGAGRSGRTWDEPVPPLVLRRDPPPGAAGAPGEPGVRALLLHGLGSSGTVWDRFCAYRPEGTETWTADLPWRGEGVWHWGQQGQATDWVAAALDGAGGRVDTVVAHSF